MNQFRIDSGFQPNRKDLMDRLRLDYRCISPDIDESAMGELHADDLAKRLAFEESMGYCTTTSNAIVIGSDQVAWREHTPMTLLVPLNVEKCPFNNCRQTQVRLFLVPHSVFNTCNLALKPHWLSIIK